MEDFHEIFRSLLGLKDIKVGFSIYNKEDDTFEHVYGAGMNSFLLNNLEVSNCSDALCRWSYHRLLTENKYISISDVDIAFKASKGQAPHVKMLHQQGIKSAIFAPIANEDGLMGILEIVSEKPRVLNSINANKLVDVMPFIVSAVERSKNEEENLIDAIIQQECTSIHQSVQWRFEQEARKYIKDQMNGSEPSFNQIVFNDIYPLFGQIDIKRSSKARNSAAKLDLKIQLSALKSILKNAIEQEALPIYEQYLYQINEWLESLDNNFQVDSEQQINGFIKHDLNPVLNHLKTNKNLEEEIQVYLNSIDSKVGTVYLNRKNYDENIAAINKNMASLLVE